MADDGPVHCHRVVCARTLVPLSGSGAGLMASSMGGRRRAQPARAEKLKLTPSL
ncbi:uncharacterized protein CPUR_07382 [Claviceps purpurea 20.1]|uniref:Uncharacterized protein n=1 Tax=Claviceps purpurea (strain 20.1) TaxID=1111077 RepID=M1VXU5_CLAP2|nr:hypothetical protein E4U27_002631 [Claviceps purpurea]CCE33457.1 uncharacterized protein CPUR_07382 [Claviceps purpurea 20.1]